MRWCLFRSPPSITPQTITADGKLLLLSFSLLTGMQVRGGSAPPPQTLGTFAQQVLDALVPNEETILKLAGMAGNGATAGGTSRVPGEGSGGAHLSHSSFASLRMWHFILSYHQ